MSAPGNEPRPVPDSHCGACGTPYTAPACRPRTCGRCGTTAYGTPLPVAVALSRSSPSRTTGAPRSSSSPARSNPPTGAALPGGFVDHAEDRRHAVVRELREETGIEAAQDEVRLADALSSPGGHLLLFGLLPALPADRLPPPAITDETAGRDLLRAPAEPAFPLHTQAVYAWFAGRYDTARHA
ncbi:NUDIX domain-containing protein [Streptomyces sp. NPDC087850]|uniref:NUDIX domain-containing protein n=1 Tax=Streptomyces sp. NPDC087850 TaxID=3365809 RepID=UPI003818F263